ncbi:ATP-binding protein [Ekhidna sp.]|uniref:ATP-binding protein n=1 Tax=Ekhidna sp. TaxID=2608089 RepID=UPI00351848E0
MRKFLFLFLIFLLPTITIGQRNEVDSLLVTLGDLKKKDSTYVNVVNDIAFRLSLTDQQQSIYYINQGISIAKEINYEKGLIRATTIKGSSFLIIGLTDQALSYYLEALSYNAEKYPMEFVRLNNNIGEVYRRKGVYDSSLKHFNKALFLAEKKLKQYLPVIILSNIGEVLLMQNQIDSAKSYFQKCLENAVSSDHLRGQGYGYYGLAECTFKEGNSDLAIDLQKQSIQSRLKADHKRGLIQSYLKLGEYFKSKSQRDSVLYYWKKAEQLASSNEANDLLNEVYNKLYTFYFNEDNIAEAAAYLNRHKNLSDSIRNAEFIGNVQKIRSALQAELVIAENEILRQEQQKAKAEEDARLIVIALGILIIAGLGITTYQYKKKQRIINETTTESNYTSSLLELSRKLNHENLDIDSFIKDLLVSSRENLSCDRATYWELSPENSLVLKGESVKPGSPHIRTVEFSNEEFPDFLSEFLQNRTVAVSRMSSDLRLQDIYERYYKPAGIEAVINAPIIADKKFIGFLSYVILHKKSREWSLQDQRFVGSLADLIVAAMAKKRGDILEIEKEELIQKLRIRNKSLQEFNSIISHNLREPLTQIIGLSDLLKDNKGKNQEEAFEIVSRISTASNRIDTVIKELSTILNESDPKLSDFRSISIDRLIKEVLDLLKSEMKSRNVTIDQNLKVTKIKSYKPFLSDALYHLLSNSLKFSYPDKRLLLKIETYEDELHNLLKISDNGRGMNLAQVGDKIFKMYQRFHLDTEGRGIGLFIVKNRISAINGLIDVDSEEGVGTSFIMKFPKNPHLV